MLKRAVYVAQACVLAWLVTERLSVYGGG